MIKRNPNSVLEGNLPRTTNDSNEMKSLPKTTKKNRHSSAGKSSVLIRLIGGTLLFFVTFLYVFGTRHVLLFSPSPPSLSSFGNQSLEEQKSLRQVEYFSRKPRTVGHYYTRVDSRSYVGTERLDSDFTMLYDNSKSRIIREEFMSKEEEKSQQHLFDSKSYDYGAAETMADQGEGCVAQYDWQETSFPTCNHLMEVDMTNLNLLPMFHEDHYNNKHDLPVASSSLHSYSKIISNGHWRDVWKIENLLRYQGKQEEITILKTMRYQHTYEQRNYDRHRRDAVVMERLTSSKFIMDIYAACGNSGLFEYGDAGDLDNAIWADHHYSHEKDNPPWTSKEKLVIAHQTASGMADLHNFAKEGVPAVAHTDVAAKQYIYNVESGVYKLNDFNRARFIGKNEKTNELCTYHVGNNPGKGRSPEEYEYERQTEKVDIYSLGNVFYSILTGNWPFDDDDDDKVVKKKVMKGERPHISSRFKNSTDPFDQALLQIIEMSWIHDPKKRASARDIQKFILSTLERLGVEKD